VHPIYGAWVGIVRGLYSNLVLFIGPRDIHFHFTGKEANKQHNKKNL